MIPEGNEPYKRLMNTIHKTDERLNADRWILDEKIDLNDSDWRKLAMQKYDVFFQRNKSLIIDCTRLLVQEFPLISDAYRKNVLHQIRQTVTLKDHLTLLTECDTDTDFRNNIILHILLDLGPDSRDWILSLRDCVEKGFQHKIAVAKHLKDLLILANDVDHHGMGSARKLIEDTLKNTFNMNRAKAL
ncbi:hypothetical protein ABIE26_005189 [Pedobacter africanus]